MAQEDKRSGYFKVPTKWQVGGNDERRARVILSVSVWLMLMTTAILVLRFLSIGQLDLVGLGVLIGSAGCLLAIAFLYAGVNLTLTSWIPPGSVGISILFSALVANDPNFAVTAHLPLVPLIFALTSGRNGVELVVVLCVAALGSVCFVHWIHDLLPAKAGVTVFLSRSAIIGVCGVIGASFESERANAEKILERMANHHALTDLPSVRAFRREVRESLTIEPDTSGVLYIDLNRFKEINDLYGHEAGDEVLRQTGDLLGSQTQQNERVFHLTGDEFTVLVSEATSEGLEALASRLESVIETAEFTLEGDKRLSLSASVGWALAKDVDSVDPTLLVQRADQSMYANKSRVKAN